MPLSDHLKGAVHHDECFRIDVEDKLIYEGVGEAGPKSKSLISKIGRISTWPADPRDRRTLSAPAPQTTSPNTAVKSGFIFYCILLQESYLGYNIKNNCCPKQCVSNFKEFTQTIRY